MARPRLAEVGQLSDDEMVVEDGELIVGEGDTSRQMFIVASGRVRVTKKQGDREVTLRTVERGEFFGEMALLEGLPRSASAYAVGDATLLVIEPGGLLLRLRRDPTLAIEMLRVLSERVRHLSNTLIQTLEHIDDQVVAEWGIALDKAPEDADED